MAAIIKSIIKDYNRASVEDKLDLEIAISLLENEGGLTDRDRDLLYYFLNGYSVEDVAKMLKVHYKTVYKILDGVSRKIANRIGITDSIILSEVEIRLNRKLTKDEMFFCNFILIHYGYRLDKRLNIYNFKVKNGMVRVND